MRVVQIATTRILRHRFPGASEMVGQVFKFVCRLHLKINAVCMSLSPLVSFKSRFVTYLLNFPRKLYLKDNDNYMFRLSFFKPSSGCNSRIFQYAIDTAVRREISFT